MATRRGQTGQDSEPRQDAQQATENGAGAQALDQESLDNLQSQLGEAMQPVISNLQQQLGQTVRQLAGQAGTGAGDEQPGSEAATADDSATDAAQSMWEQVAQTLRSIWEWIIEMARRFGNQVAEAIGNLVGLLVQRAIKSAF